MDELEKRPSDVSRADRQGDTRQELIRQGYSSSGVEEMQHQIDDGGTPPSLEQLPRPLLVANALELQIPEPQTMKKSELVEAIRRAS